jgi:uncharacterized protein (TIGR03435 family)
MKQLAKFASDVVLQVSVEDRTGLDGYFDCTWQMIPPSSDSEKFDFGANFQLMIQAIGLKFTRTTGPVDKFVIDHAERPSAN